MTVIDILKIESTQLGKKRVTIDYELSIGVQRFHLTKDEFYELKRSLDNFFNEVEKEDPYNGK